ncbi:hypothetical protein [Gillisia sp. Hel_I_29]|uniref:hypothetical protein n=1 Tax=Gillisia sp. Hel_I_29 TaxID=1249975 RepID=UPI0006903BC4|nr:hypothetical protein [Gillisia sp. Hel_I_29]
MNELNLRKNYTQLNSSFPKNITFNIGVDAGFFSEFNNMVLAMLYCLQNKIRFTIYSKKANFALKNGWTDFFIPFCEESSFYLHSRYNKRSYQLRNSNLLPPKVLKKITRSNFLTQDIWNYFRNEEFFNTRFNIPELGLDNSCLLDATQVIIKMIWQYDPQSKKIIDDHINSLNIPQNYIAIHIRSGDKLIETDLYNIQLYMKKAIAISDVKNAFILTDNYSIIEQLLENYPDWKFYTLCNPSERGYIHADFVNKDKTQKFLQHLKLFASMDICYNSDKFIGTYSSNPGMFMGMRTGEDKCFCIDYDSWILW